MRSWASRSGHRPATGRAPWSRSGRGPGCAARARRPRGRRSAATPSSSRLTSSSPSRVIWSGTRSSSSRSSTGQASAAAAQRDRGVGARPVAEAVLVLVARSTARRRRRGAAGSARRGPAAPAARRRRPAPPRRPRPAARCAPAGAGRPAARRSARSRVAQPVLEVGPRRTGRPRSGRRRRSRHRVGDRVEHRADDVLGSVGVEPVVRPRRGQPQDPVLVVGLERPHPPARLAARRLELPGRDQPQPEQRRPGQQPDAGVQVVAAVRLGQHRQRRPDRQRDRAPLVGELDDPVARRLRRHGTSPVPVTGTKLTRRN